MDDDGLSYFEFLVWAVCIFALGFFAGCLFKLLVLM